MKIIKDSLYGFGLLGFLSLNFAPLTAVAQDSPVKSVNDVIRVLNDIVGWAYKIFFIVAVMFVIFAAYKFLFAQEDPEKIKSAKNQVIYAVIAIIIALLAISFDVIIKDFLGGSQSGGSSSETKDSSSGGSSSETKDSSSGGSFPWMIGS